AVRPTAVRRYTRARVPVLRLVRVMAAPCVTPAMGLSIPVTDPASAQDGSGVSTLAHANAELPGRGGKPERDRRLLRAWQTLTSETSAMSGSTSPWRRRLHPSGPLTIGKRMLAPRATY